jgi:Tol biopolymer transport system component
MKSTISLVLVLALGMGVGVANADFTFGEATNLGPTVNSSVRDFAPTSSADGLSLYFDSSRSGGYGDKDLWVTTRPTTEDPWGEPVNLGSTVNSSADDVAPSISGDGLSLYFISRRPGGFGERDIWVTTRPTINDPWGEPVNLGPPINTLYRETGPCISSDGLELYFNSDRPGGSGGADLFVATRLTIEDKWDIPVNLGPTINTSLNDNGPNISSDGLCLIFGLYGSENDFDTWMSTRPNKEYAWSIPVNLGPPVNSSARDLQPDISYDGSTIYFTSRRPGGLGDHDLWQASIIPIVDLNNDGIVDAADMCIIVDHWGEDYSLCDIGPMPWGDGIVDVQDLIILAEHLFEEFPPVE